MLEKDYPTQACLFERRSNQGIKSVGMQGKVIFDSEGNLYGVEPVPSLAYLNKPRSSVRLKDERESIYVQSVLVPEVEGSEIEPKRVMTRNWRLDGESE